MKIQVISKIILEALTFSFKYYNLKTKTNINFKSIFNKNGFFSS